MSIDIMADVLYKMAELESRIRDLEIRDVGNQLVLYSTNAEQSIPNNSETVINFEDKIYDPHSLVTTGTWVFTVPVGGYYLINSLVTFEATSTWEPVEVLALRPLVNGTPTSQYIGRIAGLPSTTFAASIVGSGIVLANADDTIALGVFQNSDGALTLSATTGLNVISIFRISAG